ncbi:L,D-transpeptidase family protein [Labrys monachus]|uniref:Murein L,D-transpeptidase YcbB/YkuD n=1 Tax=Labrys monachus TaxID=217067 RepID=A0ABU0FEZ4_9HYPH|nr:L,D-transpeptidase family protein [Labrys monachus]MDQ0392595.1 murein L,D-transpeptidase YcbB/YkuD [Labrys monachus]
MPSISRRHLLTAFTSGIAASLLARAARANNLDLGQMEMKEDYDSIASPVDVDASASPLFSPYTLQATENALRKYTEIAGRGGWPRVGGKERLQLGDRNADVVSLRRRLVVSGDLAPSLADSDVFDSYLEGSVRRFQARHGILASGVVGDTSRAALAIPIDVRVNQLQINLVRLRAMDGNLGGRYIMMNIPATEAEAVNNGTVEQRHNTIVGRPDRPSPVMSTQVQNVNFNPFWTVPLSIIKKDLIPMMQKEPDYLADHHIRIYDPQGQEIRADQIDWNTDEATRMRFTQDPGFDNSLGQVRINIANAYGVYMHDTPEKSLFGSEYHFDSSGCARVQDVRDLCAWILQGTDYTRERIDEVIRSGDHVTAAPLQKVPVFWTYVTAWATPEGIIQFRDDIYNKDGYASLAVVSNDMPG